MSFLVLPTYKYSYTTNGTWEFEKLPVRLLINPSCISHIIVRSVLEVDDRAINEIDDYIIIQLPNDEDDYIVSLNDINSLFL